MIERAHQKVVRPAVARVMPVKTYILDTRNCERPLLAIIEAGKSGQQLVSHALLLRR
jgi:hypothetical protein